MRPADRLSRLAGVQGVGQLNQGDHTLFLGEVLEAGTRSEDQTILMRDHNLNYGG